jgi:hypothetical protein
MDIQNGHQQELKQWFKKYPKSLFFQEQVYCWKWQLEAGVIEWHKGLPS